MPILGLPFNNRPVIITESERDYLAVLVQVIDVHTWPVVMFYWKKIGIVIPGPHKTKDGDREEHILADFFMW